MIGVLEAGTFASMLEEVFSRSSEAVPYTIRRSNDVENLQDCKVVFIGLETERDIIHAIEKLRGFPVLTIGEHPGFAGLGGMIGFYKEENKIRFEINRTRAMAAGLRLSASLLRLARIIEEEDN